MYKKAIRIPYLFVLILGILFVYSCNSNQSSEQPNLDSTKSIKNKVEIIVAETLSVDTLPDVNYSILILNDSVRNQISTQFELEHLKTICALNRIDVDRLHRADSLIIPDSFYVDLIKYSPFPLKLSKADSIYKLIVISYPLQAFGVYDTGKLVRWGPLSMGKRTTQTPIGLFHTNWKSKSQISTDNSDWILPWYFNLINSTGVSLHQFELPGFPASHSCIRLREDDAQWFYNYADQWKLDSKGWNVLVEGTPVIIFGTYPFGKPRPWYSLATDSKSNRLSNDSLGSEIAPFYHQIMDEQKKRNNFYSDTINSDTSRINL